MVKLQGQGYEVTNIIITNTHLKYESAITIHSKIITKVKKFADRPKTICHQILDHGDIENNDNNKRSLGYELICNSELIVDNYILLITIIHVEYSFYGKCRIFCLLYILLPRKRQYNQTHRDLNVVTDRGLKRNLTPEKFDMGEKLRICIAIFSN